MKLVQLKSVTKIDHNSNRFDIQVANTSNFFANGILVHNSWLCAGFHPESEHPYVITSKGLSKQGISFKLNEVNNNNLYIRAINNTEIDGANVIERAKRNLFGDTQPFYILGEVFGAGVQDLTYGLAKPQFRVFDCYVGEPGRGHFLDVLSLKEMCDELHVEMVPVLYTGPFSKQTMDHFTNGLETINGTHIREGIVVRTIPERQDHNLGRVIIKSVSEAYLLRKGNVTEFS